MKVRLLRAARWGWPLLALFATVYAAQWVFGQVDFTPTKNGWVLLEIGGAFVVAVAFLVATMERWTLRSLGQLATYLGDAMLYGVSGVTAMGWRDYPVVNGAPTTFTPTEANWLRALFLVGGPCLVLGLFVWAWGNWRAGRTVAADPDVIVVEVSKTAFLQMSAAEA